jgi:hypothetical protein
MNQRTTSTNGPTRAPQALPEGRGRTGEGLSTGDVLVAVARDTLDVATELVRDGVTLAKLEVERSLREAAPRVAWGAAALVCAATATVCAIVAIMIGLGALVPSIAWRLVILAGALFLVAFFGTVRAIRPGPRPSALPASATEPPIDEGRSNHTLESRRAERLTNTMLPPPNA